MNSTTQATATEALALTEPGCDFSNEGPTIHSLAADLTGATPPTTDPPQGQCKGKGRGRGKAKAKGSGKGTKGTGEGDEENQPPPDKIPEPLAKANQLKVKVFLESQNPNKPIFCFLLLIPNFLCSARGKFEKNLYGKTCPYRIVKTFYSVYTCTYIYMYIYIYS